MEDFLKCDFFFLKKDKFILLWVDSLWSFFTVSGV